MSEKFTRLRIVILTGYDIVGLGIALVLREAKFDVVVLKSLSELELARMRPDILFLDNNFATEIDLWALSDQVKERMPDVKLVIVASQCDYTQIWLALQHHVNGYLCLGDGLEERLLQAVRDVSSGGLYLSPTASTALATVQYFQSEVHQRLNAYHREVLRLMLSGWGVEQIARQLRRSTQAIYHVQRHLRVLFDVETNIQLLQRAVRLGFRYPPDNSQEDGGKDR